MHGVSSLVLTLYQYALYQQYWYKVKTKELTLCMYWQYHPTLLLYLVIASVQSLEK